MLGQYLGAGSGITKGLYHFEGSSLDSSGNGNNGTDTDISYGLQYGRFGQGASFNGSTSKIILPTGVNTAISNSNFTIIFYINPAVTISGSVYKVFLWGSSDTSYMIRVYYYNEQAYFGSIQGVTWNSLTYTTTFSANQWYQIGVTYNISNKAKKLYINGALVGQNTGNTLTTINQLQVGGLDSYTSSPDPFNGSMDELFFENTAWSAQQVQKYYTYSRGLYGTI